MLKRKTTKTNSTIAKTNRRSAGVAAQDGIRFESLETRQMMSTVNVADFGARPGANNNTASIQAAINSSKPGDTIVFGAGNYGNISQVTLAAGRTYDGQGATLSAAAGKFVFQLDAGNANNVTIENFHFNGRSIWAVANNTAPSNIEIKDNSFAGNLYGSGNQPEAIYELGLTNSTIDHNDFGGVIGDGGVLGYGGNGLSITDNTVHDGSEGFHVIGHYGALGNITVSRNHFVNMSRIDIELQGAWNVARVEDNYCGNPNFSSVDPLSIMALSIATDGAHSVQVHRNEIISTGSENSSQGVTGIRIGIELGADPAYAGAIDCSDNYIQAYMPQGDANAITVSTSTGARVYNNHVAGGYVAASFGKGYTLTNNGPSVAVDWNINRTTVTAPTTSTETSTTKSASSKPTTVSQTQAENPTQSRSIALTAAVSSDNKIQFNYTGAKAGEVFTVQSISTVGRQTGAIVGPQSAKVSASGTIVSGFHAGWQIDVRLVAANGDASGWVTVQMTGNAAASTAVHSKKHTTAASITAGAFVSKKEFTTKTETKMATRKNPLAIHGHKFDHGFAAKENSNVKLDLNGKDSKFVAKVGLDAASDKNAKAEFEVFADGVKMYDSGVLTTHSKARNVRLDVSDKKRLQLVVINDNHSSKTVALADWAGAKLLAK